MEPLKCKMCGNAALEKDGEFFVCRYCGTKYPEKMKIELIGEVNVKGIETFDTLVHRGDTYLKLNEFEKAVELFSDLANRYPDKPIAYTKWIISLTENFDYSLVSGRESNLYSNITAIEEKLLIIATNDYLNNNIEFFTQYNQYKAYLENEIRKNEINQKIYQEINNNQLILSKNNTILSQAKLILNQFINERDIVQQTIISYQTEKKQQKDAHNVLLIILGIEILICIIISIISNIIIGLIVCLFLVIITAIINEKEDNSNGKSSYKQIDEKINDEKNKICKLNDQIKEQADCIEDLEQKSNELQLKISELKSQL